MFIISRYIKFLFVKGSLVRTSKLRTGVRGLVRWFTESLIHWVIEPLIHWFVASHVSFVHCFCGLIHGFVDLLIHWSTHSLIRWIMIHWFIPWAVHGFFHFIVISTTICSFVDAPHNFNTAWLMHRKSFPTGHWFPIAMFYSRNFRPCAGQALPGSIWEHITAYSIVSYYIIPWYITECHHITSCHTTKCHTIVPYHVASYAISFHTSYIIYIVYDILQNSKHILSNMCYIFNYTVCYKL